MGVVKAYLQLKAVIATKQMANAHAMWRTRSKNLRRKSSQQPGQYRREQKKHAEKKTERAEKVPIGPAKPLRVNADGPHQAKNRVHPPFRIILAKSKRMSGGKVGNHIRVLELS